MALQTRQVRSLFVGLFLFLGLPLLGWGILDIAGFVANPARLGYLILVAVLQVVTVIAFPNIGHHSTKDPSAVARQRLVLPILQILSLTIALCAPYSDRHSLGVITDFLSLRFFGLLLYGFSFLLMVWAEYALGRQFSYQVTVQKDHQLITTGPYQHLRHPRYLGIITVNIGYALIFRSWLAGIAVAFVAATLVWRIYDEEKLLAAQFGDEWTTYRATRYRLIPFVF